MMKELKTLSIFLAAGLLVACGSAKDGSGTTSAPLDNTAPSLVKTTPNIIVSSQNGSILLPVSTQAITFTFDEELDPNSIPTDDTLNISTSNPDVTLKGSWSYSYAQQVSNLTFTFDFTSLASDATTLLSDEIYELRFRNTITDMAGNPVVYLIRFETEQSYDVLVKTTGLSDKTVGIKLTSANKTVSHSITGDGLASGSSNVDVSYLANTSFTLSVESQPDANTFCAFSNTSGKILQKDSNVELNCSSVVPYFTNDSGDPKKDVANWNTYTQPDVNKPFIHAGEQRKFTLSNYTCADINTPVDALGAFDWACETIDTQTIIYSTGLKSGKGLSDLLDFSNHSWSKNSVTVTTNDGNNTVIETTTPAAWWNNPVVIPSSTTLSSFETIYMLTSKNVAISVLDRAYILAEKHTALVIDPDDVLSLLSSNLEAIKVANTGTWIEGTVHARNLAETGLQITGGFYTQVRNFHISDATADGIRLFTSSHTYMKNVSSSSNSGNGLFIKTPYRVSLDDVNIVHNGVFNDNGEKGILIDTSGITNKLSLITANNNQGGGISLSSNNHLSDSQIDNTDGDALTIDGHNNIVTMLTANSTNGNGIFFTTPVERTENAASNLLSSVLASNITHDIDAAIYDSNTQVNIVDTAPYDIVTDQTLPGGNLSHTLLDGTVVSFLENAVEPFNDGSGNDNGLCEANEKCLFTPNTGHSQGSGTLEVISEPGFWGATNIILQRYPATP